jgi:SR1 protein
MNSWTVKGLLRPFFVKKYLNVTYNLGLKNLMCYIIINSRILKRFQVSDHTHDEKGIEKMGTIVCQACDSTIDHFEDEKVTVLYSRCNCCDDHQSKEEK